MPIANYSTSVPVLNTVAEITGILVRAGAQATMTEYDDKLPVSVSFRIDRNGNMLHFRLPADWRAVQRVLVKQKVKPSERTDEQSRRVAWRIVRDWMRAQLALIEADCAKVEQVMLPYLVVDPVTNETLYQKFEAGKFTALPAPEVPHG